MSLSRKHFEAIADIIKSSRRNYGGQDVLETQAVLNDLVEYCFTENAFFDVEKFLARCGGSVGDRLGQTTIFDDLFNKQLGDK
tara:strand:+ start:923 stop:1171 length:249 start_codon:yes stop_codon:yes gene_type:complete